MKFSIATQFTDTPGPRYRYQGDFSGEQFREEWLVKLFDHYQKTGEVITIDLDGVFGYPTSFLEEAFGGLTRQYSEAAVLAAFDYVSTEQPDVIEEIKADIETANKKRR